MELDKINMLMEKYFEATTTVAEEEVLRNYFLNEKVAPHLEQYTPLFQFFSRAKEERFTKQVPLKPRKQPYRWLSVAAVAVLVFGIYFGRSYQEKREAEFAYQQTKKALTLLASNFSRGTEKVAYLKEFEVAKQKIYNNN
ncbi:hypothetical protein [Sediminicola arcticus]|jgi:hypothetical protein|uniref:Uncharacterized protein n=1 Tax=Sediminicola arcticus TaxID=1574308 RepID=A0ABV2SZV8_9FLAO